ncbi:MAG: VCBS repeat-containing protein [Planctomycetota bacterium]|nr:MAG: VCBS repeat-containing protein [Planctomycetota bacterium]
MAKLWALARLRSTVAMALSFVVVLAAGCYSSHDRTGEVDDSSASDVAEAPISSQFTTARDRERRAERDELLDPNQDGWQTEAFADQATKQLKQLGKWIAAGKKLSAKRLAKIADEKYRSPPLRPRDLEEVYSGPLLTVHRSAGSAAAAAEAAAVSATQADASDTATYHGPDGFAQALAELMAGLDASADPQVAVKVVFVDVADGAHGTTIYWQAAAETATGHAQHTATWQCKWTAPEADQPPRLLNVRVVEYEETRLDRGEQGKLFADYTESALGNQESYRRQLLFGNHHWGSLLDRTLGLRLRGLRGLAVGDVNADGLDDVYVCEPGGLPNLLYLQMSDGSFRDVSRSAGVDFLDPASSALFVDFDNDGDQDLVVASPTAITILSNNGQGIFAIRTLLDGGEAFQPTAVDYDSDGDLDLYIIMYEPFGHEDTVVAGVPIAIPYHDANNGKPNVLYRNDGNWKFTDVTSEVGLDENNQKFSLAATWEDFDLDGDQDLYVANDFGRNNLYRFDSETGRFDDIAADAGVEDMSTGMSASFGDFDRDGWPDLYVANMWSSAGNRITYQRQFRTPAENVVKSQFQYMARGNSLFSNAKDGRFRDLSLPAGVTMGRWAWGSVFADLNNDGWEDILVANGYVTGSDSGDL